ncbi:MAG: hypothetical protein L0H93_15825, partial [Nocardioides sp.]|nr:hypothetical protein [Nocardioides sp.]
QVRPPDAPLWERSAENWLLDICPPEFRTYRALRGDLVVLVRFAVLHVEACQQACDRGVSQARGELRDFTTPEVLEEAIETFQSERARLLGVRRAVGLVEEALRGRRFAARL